MKITYNYSISELVKGPFRGYTCSKSYKKDKLRNAVIFPLLIFTILSACINKNIILIIYLFLISLIISIVLYIYYDKSILKKMIKFHNTEHGKNILILVTYEINENYLIIHESNNSVSLDLNCLNKVKLNQEDIEIIFLNNCIFVIPNAAFSTQYEKETFIKLLNKKC